MAPTDEHLPSLPAEILVTFSWRDVKIGVFIRYWMGSLTPELWVRTWACRISLDAEWWEESEKSYDDICRISKSLTNRDNRSNGLARGQIRTTAVNFGFRLYDSACDISFCCKFSHLTVWNQEKVIRVHWGDFRAVRPLKSH